MDAFVAYGNGRLKFKRVFPRESAAYEHKNSYFLMIRRVNRIS